MYQLPAIGIYPDDLNYIYHEIDFQVDESFLGNVVQQWEDEVNQFEKLHIKVAKIRIGIVLAKNGGALQKWQNQLKWELALLLDQVSNINPGFIFKI